MEADSARTTLVFGPTGRIGWALLNDLNERIGETPSDHVLAVGRRIPEIALEALPRIRWRALPELFRLDRDAWRELARESLRSAPLSIINLLARNPVDAADTDAPEITADFLISNVLFPALLNRSFDRARIVNVSSIARYELNRQSGPAVFSEDDSPADPEILEFVTRWARWIERLADEWTAGGLDRKSASRQIIETLRKNGYRLPPGIRAYGASKLMDELLPGENKTSLILTDVYGLFDPRQLLGKTAGPSYSPLAASVVSGPLRDLVANRPIHLDFGPNPNRQSVDLIYMPDVLNVLRVVAGESAAAFPEGRYNLTSGEPLIPAELADIFEGVRERIESTSTITCSEAPVEQRFRFDPSRLQHRLLEQGLAPFEPTAARDGLHRTALAYAALSRPHAA